MTLRDYQAEGIERLRDRLRRGVRRLLLHAPTGSGKTVVAASIIQGAMRLQRSTMFLAHRVELIDQCSNKLLEWDVPHGIIRASDPRRDPRALCQVASVPTLVRRAMAPPADLIIVDECHRARAESYQQILKRYPKAAVIGLTATPVRGDGKGLGTLFEEMVQLPGVADLTDRGWLVPVRPFVGQAKVDLKGVKSRGGDYSADELEERVDTVKLVGDIVDAWKKNAAGRPTVVFAVGIKHSRHIAERFLEAGIRAEHLDGETDEDTRRAVLFRLAHGGTQIVTNCGILTEGWDCPVVSCVVLARPTKSLGLYLQMVGRTLRPAPGKSDCIVLDHAGATEQHGFVDEDREWTLEDGLVRQAGERAMPVRVCEMCFCAFDPRVSSACPACGHINAPKNREPLTVAGEMVELKDRPKKKKLSPWAQAEWDRLKRIQQEKGYKPGWVYFRFKTAVEEKRRERSMVVEEL